MSEAKTSKFAGKAALITGGARGIGLAIAQRLADESSAIALLDLDLAAAREAAQDIAATYGVPAIAISCDVADPAAMDAAAREAEAALGGIDMLVANAGLHLSGYVKPVTQLPITEWQKLLNVNVLGVLNSANACRPAMQRRGGGVIVTIASMAGYKADSAYGISKLALRGLTVALARDLSVDRIRVCGVAPGLIASDAVLEQFSDARIAHYVDNLQLIHRLGHVQDIAATVSFLMSDDASFITAETLLVTGGAYVRI